MPRPRRRLLTALFALAAFAGLTAQTAVETLSVTLNKTVLLKFDSPVADVIVGNSVIAEVAVASDRMVLLNGTSAGETNLIVLSAAGTELMSANVVVVPERERHVTVHRNGEETATFSCRPRCTRVKGPDAEESKAPTAPAPLGDDGAGTNGETGGGQPAEATAPVQQNQAGGGKN